MSGAIPPIGTLTDRVQIRRKEMTGEAEGGFSTLHVPLATVWARVRSLSEGRATFSMTFHSYDTLQS